MSGSVKREHQDGDCTIVEGEPRRKARCYQPSPETENFFRLCHLLCSVCSDLFRELLDKFIDPNELSTKLSAVKEKLFPFLNREQKQMVYPTPHGACSVLRSRDMDLSLLYVILRNACPIPAHSRGWGNTPDQTDESLSAHIDKIREERNIIQGHLPNGHVQRTQFEAHWYVIEKAMTGIEQELGGVKFISAIRRLRFADLNPTLSNMYVEELDRMMKMEKSILETIRTKMETVNDNNEMNTRQVVELIRSQGQQFQQILTAMGNQRQETQTAMKTQREEMKTFRKELNDIKLMIQKQDKDDDEEEETPSHITTPQKDDDLPIYRNPFGEKRKTLLEEFRQLEEEEFRQLEEEQLRRAQEEIQRSIEEKQRSNMEELRRIFQEASRRSQIVKFPLNK